MYLVQTSVIFETSLPPLHFPATWNLIIGAIDGNVLTHIDFLHKVTKKLGVNGLEYGDIKTKKMLRVWTTP